MQSAMSNYRSALLLLLIASPLAAGSLHYVSSSSTGGVPPYGTWETAASNIQDAVQVAVAGATVLVTNGIYDSGGALTPGYALSNRVCVTNAVIVRSVNGPAASTILGQGPLGSNAVRCAYLTNGAMLVGFTLSNGYTMGAIGHIPMERGGGGALITVGCTVTNCVVTGCAAQYGGGGGVLCCGNGTVRDSVVVGNTVNGSSGGGVYCLNGGLVTNCVLAGNMAPGGAGGGAAIQNGGTVVSCVITGNWNIGNGGGVYLNYRGVVDRCLLAHNVAAAGGGVKYMLGPYCQVVNCLIVSNEASWRGGGADMYWGGSIINCTLVDNTATNGPGAAGIYVNGTDNYSNLVVNSIVYHNNGNELVITGSLWAATYSCIASNIPGAGNITNDPLLIAADRLSDLSPCRDTGTNQPWMATATDLDGNPRIYNGIVDMGCYEMVPEPAAAAVAVILCVCAAVRTAKRSKAKGNGRACYGPAGHVAGNQPVFNGLQKW